MTQHEPRKVWIDEYKIHSYEVDVRGELALPMLCQFMQESAWHHAENLKVGFSQLIRDNLIWVLAQQYIKVDTYPKWSDTIHLHTWPSGRGRLSYFRDFRILDDSDNLLAVATTKWYVIHTKTRKPANIDSQFSDNLKNIEQACSHQLEKVPALSSHENGTPFKVRYTDLDVNEHVNNVKYVEWLIQNYDLDFHKSNRLSELNIVYFQEALYNDDLVIFREDKSDLCFHHSVIRHDGNTEICRAKLRWK